MKKKKKKIVIRLDSYFFRLDFSSDQDLVPTRPQGIILLGQHKCRYYRPVGLFSIQILLSPTRHIRRTVVLPSLFFGQ